MAEQQEGRASRQYADLLTRVFPGSRWVKIHGHEMQEAGIPDLLGCVSGRFVAIEMKIKDHDGPTALQKLFIRDLLRAGAIALVWWHDPQRPLLAQVDELARDIRRKNAEA